GRSRLTGLTRVFVLVQGYDKILTSEVLEMSYMIRIKHVLLLTAGLLPTLLGWSATAALPDGIAAQSAELFRDANSFWSQEFVSLGGQYLPAALSQYRQRTNSACETPAALAGPFYCPADQHVYLDLAFLEQVAQRAQSASDLALAYIIGHE